MTISVPIKCNHCKVAIYNMEDAVEDVLGYFYHPDCWVDLFPLNLRK